MEYLSKTPTLNRDLKDIIIIDNSETSFLFHPTSAIHIKSFFDDNNDDELLKLIPFLRFLSETHDIRSVPEFKLKFDSGNKFDYLNKNQMQALCDKEHYSKHKSNEHTTEEDYFEHSKRRFLDEENMIESLEDKKESDVHIGIDKQNRKTLKLHAKNRSFKVKDENSIEPHSTDTHKMSVHQREQSDKIPLRIYDDEDEEATNTHGNNDEKILESRT